MLQNDTWQFEQQVLPTDIYQNARFGSAVDIMGPYMVVGAYGHATDSANQNPIYEAGAGYFFERINGSWVQMKKVSSQIRLNTARFGYRVAIINDRAIISAPKDAYDQLGQNPIANAGAAFHYKRNPNDSLWYEQEKMLNNPRGGGFGTSLSMTDSFAFIGTPELNVDTFYGAGVATLFHLGSSGNYSLAQKVHAPVTSFYDNFGWSCGLTSTHAVVGAYSEDEDENETNTLASTGSAYIFRFDPVDDTLIFEKKITAPESNRDQGDWFGWSVGISSDCILAGAVNEDTDTLDTNYVYNAGAVYFFDTICPSDLDSSVAAICAGDTYNLGTLALTESGVYSYTFENLSGCDSIITLTLTVIENSTGIETVSACDSYIWPVNSISYTQSGDYTAVMSNSAGCDSLITLHLTILESTESTITKDTCIQYRWSANQQLYTASGNYTEVFVGSNGCDSAAHLDLTIREVDIDIIVFFGQLSSNASNAQFQWIRCDSGGFTIVPGATGPLYKPSSPSESGNFALIVTQNGCTDTSACNYVDFPGGIDAFESRSFSIYPNPASESVTISSNRASDATFWLVDVTGRALIGPTLLNGRSELSTAQLQSGLYFIKIEETARIKSFPLIVIH